MYGTRGTIVEEGCKVTKDVGTVLKKGCRYTGERRGTIIEGCTDCTFTKRSTVLKVVCPVLVYRRKDFQVLFTGKFSSATPKLHTGRTGSIVLTLVILRGNESLKCVTV